MLSNAVGCFLVAPAICAAVLAFLMLRGKRSPEMVAMAGVPAGIALIAFGYGIEILRDDIHDKLVGLSVVFLGCGVVVPAFLISALWFSGEEIHMGSRRMIAIVAAPAALALLAVTNGLHGLFYSVVGVQTEAGLSVVQLRPELLFWLYMLVLLSYPTAGMAVVAGNWSTAARRYRRQLVIISLACLPPIVMSTLFLFGWHPVGPLNPLPFALLFTGVVFFLTLYRPDHPDIRPLARDLLMERFPDGILVVDRDGLIVDHNNEAVRLLDLTLPVLGRSAVDVLRAIPRLQARVSADTSAEVELNGRVVDVRSAKIIRADGRSAGLILQIHDVTDAREAEHVLSSSLRREAKLGELSRMLSITRPLEDLPAMALPVIAEILGTDRCSMLLEVDGLSLGASWTRETGLVALDGQEGLLAGARDRDGLTLMLDARGVSVGVLSCLRDEPFVASDETVAETARWMLANAISNTLLVRDLEKAARTDALTGLNNRASFIEAGERELQLALRHHRSLCFALCDLDHFKLVNDRHGHVAGDAVLIEAARRIGISVRATDLVCRWGGEEFAVLMPESDLRSGRMVAERIRREVGSRPIPFENGELTITVSVGVSALDETSENQGLLAMTERADQALYAAKHAGRNQVMLDAEKVA